MSEHPATDRTGNLSVDAVLDEVEEVGLRPLTEQVEVYERAHERLRRALDAPADSGDSGVSTDADQGA